MKKLLPIALILGLMACKDEDVNEPLPTEFGFLKMGISLDIDELPANGRVAAVNTDAFLVNIYDNTDVLVQSFDPFSTAPAEIQLPTGEYYITASSNDLVEAAFDSPYYFGRSDNFTIDKEELKSIDVTAHLANSKVAINYSANVVNTFTSYTGQVTVNSSATTLAYPQGETRTGYFVSGGDLFVEVFLSYTKLDGSTIDRTFSTTIASALAKTQYNVNVEATLADGEIAINLIVDEGVDELDVELGENSNPYSLEFDGVDDYIEVTNESNFDFERVDEFTFEAWIYTREYNSATIFNKVFAGSADRGFRFALYDTYLYFALFYDRGSTNELVLISDGELPLNQWTHVAAVYDGSNNANNVKLYINGVEQGNNIISNSLSSTTLNDNPFRIGSYNGLSRFFNGFMDEIRVWSDVRTEIEIQTFMNQELTGTEGSLVSYFNFNEGTGAQLVTDKTGNSEGSLVNIDANTAWSTDTPF